MRSGLSAVPGIRKRRQTGSTVDVRRYLRQRLEYIESRLVGTDPGMRAVYVRAYGLDRLGQLAHDEHVVVQGHEVHEVVPGVQRDARYTLDGRDRLREHHPGESVRT
jgi:hypothetical protein